MELKPFDRNDWNAYMGTEGNNPVIAYGEPITLDGTTYENTVVICDDNGVHVDIMNSEYEMLHTFQLDTDRQSTAEFIVKSLAWDRLITEGLKGIGFYFTDYSD